MTSKILITGANGFVGCHLARFLVSKGECPRCLVRKTSNINGLNGLPVEIVYGDVLDMKSLAEALKDVSCVFHLAGITREKRNGDFQRMNADGTHNILKECKRTGTKPRFIYVSSLAASGSSRAKKSPCVETDIPKPVSAYGKSKLSAEKHVLDFSDDIPCTIVRPPFVFGEYDEYTASLFRLIKKTGLNFSLGWGSPLFSFVHADDLSELLIHTQSSGETVCYKSHENGQGIYFASGNEHVSFAEFGQIIGSAFGKKRVIALPVGPFNTYSAAIFFEVIKKIAKKNVPLDWNKAIEVQAAPWTCSNEKAAKQLGFSPKSLPERITQTAGHICTV